MGTPDDADRSNGYEQSAAAFMAVRSRSDVGVATVRRWAASLPPGAVVLELGCGHGLPISAALHDAGVKLYAVDASASLVAAFRDRFPDVPVERGAVEDSDFFGRTFDGIVAWGLMFLLAPHAQADLIRQAAAALRAGGAFLFTAPAQRCEWSDILTGAHSMSLGADTYRRLLEAEGLRLTAESDDEGQNHYFFVRKPGAGHDAA